MMLREAAPPKDSAEVAAVLLDLALLLCDMGRLAEVETLARRALAIRERLLGFQHPLVAFALSSRAQHLDIRSTSEIIDPEIKAAQLGGALCAQSG